VKRPTHERIEAARQISERYASGHTQISLAEQRVLADGFDALYAIAALGLPNDALEPEQDLTPEEVAEAAERSRKRLASLAIPGFSWKPGKAGEP
jgi:hypothetical protein